MPKDISNVFIFFLDKGTTKWQLLSGHRQRVTATCLASQGYPHASRKNGAHTCVLVIENHDFYEPRVCDVVVDYDINQGIPY